MPPSPLKTAQIGTADFGIVVYIADRDVGRVLAGEHAPQNGLPDLSRTDNQHTLRRLCLFRADAPSIIRSTTRNRQAALQ